MKSIALLALIFISFNASAASWVEPSEREDGSKITHDEISGYSIYCGSSSKNYPTEPTFEVGNVSSYKLTFPTAGWRYCAMKTIDTGGRMSSTFSNEMVKEFVATVPASTKAKPLTNIKITQIDGLRYKFTYDLPTEFTDGKPIHSITKVYPFEIFEYTPPGGKGDWVTDINPPVDHFERTLTEGPHFYHFEVETCVNGKCEVSELSEMAVVDVKLNPAPVLPIKPPMNVKFDDNDSLMLNPVQQ